MLSGTRDLAGLGLLGIWTSDSLAGYTFKVDYGEAVAIGLLLYSIITWENGDTMRKRVAHW